MLQGVRVSHDAYSGGWLDWLTPFSVLTGVSVVVGYASLGATWLIWKTEGEAQQHARRLALWLGFSTLGAMAAVSAATPFLAHDYWRRWLAMPNILLTAQVPLLVAIASAVFFWSLRRGSEKLPFLMALSLFLPGFIGLGISIYPYAVPCAITIWDAAAAEQSQIFMLTGAVVIIPLILTYTGWAYWYLRQGRQRLSLMETPYTL